MALSRVHTDFTIRQARELRLHLMAILNINMKLYKGIIHIKLCSYPVLYSILYVCLQNTLNMILYNCQ